MARLGHGDVSGALIRLGTLAAVLVLPAVAAAQNANPNDPAQARHRLAVRTERTARFFEAWEAASVERREAAERLLREERRPGAPVGSRPELPALAKATHVLRGAESADSREDALQRFADSLDLQVTPGAFGPAASGRGEALTVRVYRAFDDAPAPDVELELQWLAADGTAARARREPFAGTAFKTPGFLMYVRAPLSEPATWRLVPVVRADGREARGAPVLVECVADLSRRATELEDAGGEEAAILSLLLTRGLRHPEVERPSDLLAALESDGGHPRGFLRADGASGAAGDAGLAYSWGGFPSADCRRVVVFFLPADEGAESVLQGPVGEAWVRFARERGVGLFVHRARSDGAHVLAANLHRLARGEPERELVLVARGNAIWILQLMLLAPGDPSIADAVDALVLASPTATPAKKLPAVPTLVVSPELPEGETPAHVLHVRDATTCFLAEPSLPRLVGEWLDEREAQRDR